MPTSETLDLAALDEAGFQKLYAEKIGPLFEGFEQPRQAAVTTFRRRMWRGGPAALGLGIAAGLAFQSVMAGLMVAVFSALGVAVWAYGPLQKVGGQVKQSALDAIAAVIGVRYRHKDFPPAAFDRCGALGLTPSHDRSTFEDHFQGARHGCGFDLYEAHLEDERRDKDGDTTWVTVFRGQIIRIVFPKRFLGVTVVRRDRGLFNAFGGRKGFERVGLADPEFEKLFEVYSTDQVEARTLVQPVFVARLVDLEKSFDGKRIRCAFEGGELLVAIEGGDKFEPGNLFKTLIDPARARKLVDEIAQIMRLMDAVVTAETAPLLAMQARAGKDEA